MKNFCRSFKGQVIRIGNLIYTPHIKETAPYHVKDKNLGERG